MREDISHMLTGQPGERFFRGRLKHRAAYCYDVSTLPGRADIVWTVFRRDNVERNHRLIERGIVSVSLEDAAYWEQRMGAR